MNVGDFLTHTAHSLPARVAFYWDERTRTYAESNARADAFAHELRRRGLAHGDRVALLLDNRPEVLEAMFGCWKAGLAVVPLNARFTPAEIEFHLDDAGARLVVAEARHLAAIAALRARLPGLEHVLAIDGEGADSWETVVTHGPGTSFSSVRVEGDELAWLAYTSGTTGRPKGAMLTHAVLVFEVLGMLADFFPLGPEHVGIHAAPLTHGSGHVGLVFTAKGCGQVILSRSGFDPLGFLTLVERHRVNALFLVPTIIKLVVEHADVDQFDLSSLRWVFYGGSPMYVEDLRRAIGKLGPIFIQGFGQTESPMTGTYLPAAEHDLDGPNAQRLLSCGRVRTGIELRILDAQDQELPSGEIGEICLRGGSVMKGYWRRPDDTAETLRNGWLHTGDLGMMDRDGYVYILDRSKDMVISGGLNIYPREIEELLLQHPAIAEACVFGVPDAKWGEALAAHLVTRADVSLTEAEVLAHLGERAAGYKKPKQIRFVEALPRTSYGKIDKKAVRAPYWAGQARQVR